MQSASARFLYYSLWVPIQQEGFSTNSANYLHHQDALLTATPTESQAYICVMTSSGYKVKELNWCLVRVIKERHSLCCFLLLLLGVFVLLRDILKLFCIVRSNFYR